MKTDTITDHVAYKVTDRIIKSQYKDNFPDEENTLHVMRFLISNIIPLILILIIGIIIGNLWTIISVVLGFVLLRMLSGGYHIKNADICFLVSILLIVVLSLVPLLPEVMLYIFRVVAFLIVLIYAPSNIVENTVVRPEKHIYFKYASLIFVSISFFLDNGSFILGLFTQSLSLVNFNFVKEVNRIE
ncbi:accessory gene regulator B family protein [Paenibacillus polymyxa]|uniref:accessory gene regulator B family protein n=1 Tax=Paenibacillus polymyxa TaxID=1406 RepID=UPI0039BD65A0